MKFRFGMATIAGLAAALVSCSDKAAQEDDFKYLIDEFADLKIMRYRIPGWDNLSLGQKEIILRRKRIICCKRYGLNGIRACFR